MKKIITLFLLALTCFNLNAQKSKCVNNLDKDKVFTLISQKDLYLKQNRAYAEEVKRNPKYGVKILFDSAKCHWLVISENTGFRPNKKTNGITIVNTQTVIIDANTKKIFSNKKIKREYPNYE